MYRNVCCESEDVLSAVYYQLEQYIDHHFITKDQYKQKYNAWIPSD